MGVKIRKGVQAGYFHLGPISMCMVFKTMGMDEIAWGENSEEVIRAMCESSEFLVTL